MSASSTVCNIGDVGVSRRRAGGWIALAVGGALAMPLTDDAERRALDARARGIHARGLGLALLLTLVAVLVPGPRSHP